ncbi:MAG: methionine--tRNA ligase [Cytophagales bacterium]|nr:MAG: methionine--tRNA ligase [Cytophagales bacterium]
MSEQKKYKRHLLTAALLYANGPIHVGHLAGCYIPADIYARYLRAKGEEVLFVSGSDEHGVAITMKAEKEKTTPQAIIDLYHHQIKNAFEQFGISFDIYARTSSNTHHETASAFFKKFYDQSLFEEKETEQFYDPEVHQFLADRYIIGTCPKCGNENAFGDQCEKCGSTLSPDELINPRSAYSNAQPIKKKTTHWFLPLQNYETWLKEWIINEHAQDWKPNVYGQCKSWIEQGLQARAMTRDLNWGIPVPLPQAKGKVLYVWFDAPIGYISATKEYFDQKQQPARWKEFWQEEETQLVHFIGKDNIVFHCIIFPAMLKAHGGFVLPAQVPANEFMNLEGEKISTSRNWAVWLHEYLAEFPEKQDVLRYYLTTNAPETKDSDFTWKDFQARNNSELVANLGNFINRAVVLTGQNFNAQLPTAQTLESIDLALENDLKTISQKIEKSLQNYRFKEAIGSLMELSSVGNKYLQDNAPWKLLKENNKDRAATVLHCALQLVANLSILAEPFLPFTAQKIRTILNIEKPLGWQKVGSLNLLNAEQKIENIGLLFEKIEDTTIEFQIEKLNKSKNPAMTTTSENNNQAATITLNALKESISYEDFQKIDLRIATIKTAERVKGSKKILKLQLEAGNLQPIVASGIGEYFEPEAIIGKQVCWLANLAPRKIMGVESQGMILMTTDSEGKLLFMNPEGNALNGAEVR